MRYITATAVALLLAAPQAMAISRVEARTRSCAAIQDMIAKERAIILRYPSRDGRMTLYDRYVVGTPQCGSGFYASRAYVPASDGSCPVYNCKPTTNLSP